MHTICEVTVRDNETLDQALKRFRRKIRKERLMEQMRSLMQYEKPSDEKRRKAREGKYRGKGTARSKKSPPESVARIPNDLLEEFTC